ncbi:glycosyltransferase, partial [Patescibacteria group bacterium]
IIVVNDGGEKIGSDTFAKYSNIKIYEYEQNKGKGYALKYGFEKCRGEYIIFIDGDMELHPKDIYNFFVLRDIYDVDIVIGSKRHAYSKVEYPLFRRVLSLFYQLFIRIFLDLKGVKDTQVGLKLFKREVLAKSLPRVLIKRYAFDLELLTVASHLGYKKILEAPITLNYSEGLKLNSWQGFVHLFKVAIPLMIDTLAIIYRLRILKYYDKHNYSV